MPNTDRAGERMASEMLVAQQYELRIMGIPMEESTLKEMHLLTFNHMIRGNCVPGVMLIAKEDGDTSLARHADYEPDWFKVEILC